MIENKDEVTELRAELEKLKEQMKTLTDEPSKSRTKEKPSTEPLEPVDQIPVNEPEPPTTKPRRKRIYYTSRANLGDRLGDYIEGFVEDVMEGVSVELERSLFHEPQRRKHRSSQRETLDAQKTASVMSALGNEHRLKILDELSYGGAYSAGLQEALPEISASTLSSHLDVLAGAGLITQERRRGRYLITMPGRIAVKMANQISSRIRERYMEP
jgi:DNA-binding transcriptional ArsR family regulator